MNTIRLVTCTAAILSVVGCIQLKTESEIKPIHITMDVNLKVDKELDKAFADETQAAGKGDFAATRQLLDRRVAGVTNTAMLEPREGATDDDRITIAEGNVRRLRRFNEIAKSSGVKIDAVQRRYALKLREKIPAGTWYQADDGTWAQK